MCRETLDELTEFVRHYHRALRTSGVDDRFETIADALPPVSSTRPGRDEGMEGIVLTYAPYREPFSQEARWAAATEAPPREPLRYCSADGRYVLREVSGQSPSRPLFCLVADKGVRMDSVELIIDGVRCRPGADGTLDTNAAGLRLKRESRITLRTARPA